MRLPRIVLALALCFTLGQPGVAGAWSGTTADEFDMRSGSRPDPGLWGYDTGTGWGAGGEVQTYTDSTDNVYQDGDHLVLQAIKTDGRLHLGPDQDTGPVRDGLRQSRGPHQDAARSRHPARVLAAG